ncbi:glycosyltransferase family 4 protein [Candidatus Sumerlaeota bacterium]|nr:glycosyltransferase family 4 protein [Candidatus Sumerlaeota bacterium]
MRPRVDQALAGMHAGDAITHDALAMRAALRRAGHESDILCDLTHLGPEMRGEARDFRTHRVSERDLVIYHCAIASPLTEWYLGLRCRRLMRYHNITPAEHFLGFNDRTAAQLAQGRRTLPRLAVVTDLALCDSAYNATELDAVGFARTEVLPIVIDFASFDEAPDGARLSALRGDPRPKILFVGRVVPNKRQEDLIKVQAIRQHAARRDSLLFLVGSYGGAQRYLEHLVALRRRLRVEDTVHFTGLIPQADLLAFFRAADLFLCLSEHEGFCVPLIEAMHHRIPIIAFAAGAVPETLGDAGILVREKHLPAIAEMVDIALTDESLRSRIRARQAKRILAFAPERVERRFLEIVESEIG